MNKKKENWTTKLGVILAVSGSAVGLGNFLRFPVQAAQNGGGAFMIPYFVSLILLGIPLMWIEWTAGRFGGGFGHSTAPGIFHTLVEKNRFIKYFGIIGIFGPVVIFIYYTYIESWLLGYMFFSLTGKLFSATNQEEFRFFLSAYQGLTKNNYFSSIIWAYLFFVITFFLNTWIIYSGLKKGIEKLCNFAMPLLLIMGIILVIKIATLFAPDTSKIDWNFLKGLEWLWTPDFSVLKNAKVWIAAAGQIFFTLSVGIGVILTYASYLKKNDDVVLSGLTSVSTNEFVEVIIGGSLVIPAAYMFFGPENITNIAKGGAFDLGFITMPLIFHKINFGALFAVIWFMLLFLAGITSSVSLALPGVAFLEDEFDISRKKAVFLFSVISFILCQPVIFFLSKGVLNELDFWAGTFCLVLFGTIETIVFTWIFGIDKAWEEIHRGADINVPKIYKFIMKYITPLFLIFIICFWFIQDWIPVILMENIKPENKPYILLTRIGLLCLFFMFVVLVRTAWRRRALKNI